VTSISASSAFKDEKRVLPQHQAALTLLQGMLANPKVVNLNWLDLACGRGQIIVGLKSNLSDQARAKLYYFGFDVKEDFVKETQKTASELGLKGHEFEVGYLSNFIKICPHHLTFDFITLTNTVHEVSPKKIAATLMDCLSKLSQAGCLYIYDMESISPFEVGAVAWTKTEIFLIIKTMFDALGIKEYIPEVGQWSHHSCNGWNVQIQREHVNLNPEELAERQGEALAISSSLIKDLLSKKLEHCKSALETLTLYGSETQDEQAEKERLLYDFWAINRALEDE